MEKEAGGWWGGLPWRPLTGAQPRLASRRAPQEGAFRTETSKGFEKVLTRQRWGRVVQVKGPQVEGAGGPCAWPGESGASSVTVEIQATGNVC